MWKLKPGWLAERSSEGIEFFCDNKGFRLNASKKQLDDFFVSDTFIIQTSDNNSTKSQIISRLSKLGIISIVDSSQENWYSSLQSQYFFHINIDPQKANHLLKRARVMVLGLGGMGAMVLQQLAASGIGEFILIDSDIVETSNLERQLIYSIDSVGKFKVDEAKKFVLQRNQSAKVVCYVENIDSSNLFEKILNDVGQIDLCAICVDHPPQSAFNLTSRVLWKYKIPFIHGGVMQRSGFWGPLFSLEFDSPNPYRFVKLINDTGLNALAQPTKICFSPFNSVISAQMAGEIIHFLAGATNLVSFTTRTFVDFQNLVYKKISAE